MFAEGTAPPGLELVGVCAQLNGCGFGDAACEDEAAGREIAVPLQFMLRYTGPTKIAIDGPHEPSAWITVKYQRVEAARPLAPLMERQDPVTAEEFRSLLEEDLGTDEAPPQTS